MTELLNNLLLEDVIQVMILNSRHPKFKYWKEAFDLYNFSNPDKMRMGCRPCYFKVYYFLKSLK